MDGGILVLRRRGIRRGTPYTQGGRQGLSVRDRIDDGSCVTAISGHRVDGGDTLETNRSSCRTCMCVTCMGVSRTHTDTRDARPELSSCLYSKSATVKNIHKEQHVSKHDLTTGC